MSAEELPLQGAGMLESRRFLVREQVKFLQSHHTYEIYDGDSGEKLGLAEEQISFFNKFMRWFVSKQLMSTVIEVREEPDQSLVFTINRGWYIFRSTVEVHDAMGTLIGYFQSKLFSWSGGFWVYDSTGQQLAEVTGSFWGFNYRMTTPDRLVELGHVTKKWSGLAHEMFTSADSYMVETSDDLEGQPMARMLLLAAALATDMIFKSHSSSPTSEALDGV